MEGQLPLFCLEVFLDKMRVIDPKFILQTTLCNVERGGF